MRATSDSAVDPISVIRDEPTVTSDQCENEPTMHHEQGEQPEIAERLIVSPVGGLFGELDPSRRLSDGDHVSTGQPIAVVGNTEVTSSFDGQFMGLMAIPGERIAIGQPIAWLRTP